MAKTLLIIGTNRPESISGKYATLLHSKLEGSEILTAFQQSTFVPKTNNLEISGEDTKIVWFIPTYHNSMSGYSKMILDSLTDETITGLAKVEHIIISTSKTTAGATQFADSLTSAVAFQGLTATIKSLADTTNYTYGEVSDNYLQDIVKTVTESIKL